MRIGDFGISEIVVILSIVTIILIVSIFLIFLSNKKKDTISKGKKSLVVFLTILTSFAFVLTPLVYHNFVPLSLHLGYFIENKDFDHNGKISGYKFTMEDVSIYNQMDVNRLDSPKDSRTTYKIESGKVIIGKGNDEKIFEIRNFGKELYVDGVLAYFYFQDIDMR